MCRSVYCPAYLRIYILNNLESRNTPATKSLAIVNNYLILSVLEKNIMIKYYYLLYYLRKIL